VKEHACFPADLDDLPLMLEQHNDAILIGLDSDPEYAFDLVESLCADNSTSVMVYSAQTNLEQAIRLCAPAPVSSSYCPSSMRNWPMRWTGL